MRLKSISIASSDFIEKYTNWLVQNCNRFNTYNNFQMTRPINVVVDGRLPCRSQRVILKYHEDIITAWFIFKMYIIFFFTTISFWSPVYVHKKFSYFSVLLLLLFKFFGCVEYVPHWFTTRLRLNTTFTHKNVQHIFRCLKGEARSCDDLFIFRV